MKSNTNIRKLPGEAAGIIGDELAAALTNIQNRFDEMQLPPAINVMTSSINVLLTALKDVVEPEVFLEFMQELYQLYTKDINKMGH